MPPSTAELNRDRRDKTMPQVPSADGQAASWAGSSTSSGPGDVAVRIADRRRRRPDGPGADRRDARRLLVCARRRPRRRRSPAVGRDAGERFGRATGVIVASDVDAAARAADVLIDFTRPEGTLAHLAACARHGTGAVVGTTGLSDAQRRRRSPNSPASIPIVFAPNMSVGVNVLANLVETAARRLGPGYDIEIVEMHHRHKVDAPSGTALLLGEAAARGAGRKLAAMRGLRARRRHRRTQGRRNRVRGASRRRRRR